MTKNIMEENTLIDVSSWLNEFEALLAKTNEDDLHGKDLDRYKRMRDVIIANLWGKNLL